MRALQSVVHTPLAKKANQPKAEEKKVDLLNPFADATALSESLVDDCKEVFSLLKKMAPSVVFFGGARIKEHDPIYSLSRQIGAMLKRAGVPVKTGAGPGAMESVVRGHIEADKGSANGIFRPLVGGVSSEAPVEDVRTQGINMNLPHEDELNPYIEVGTRLDNLAYRKVGLYSNVRGIVNLPGGYGTMDEMFEVWAKAAEGKHSDPMYAVGTDFFSPILDAIHQVAVKDRALISEEDFKLLKVVDSADELLQGLATAENVKGFEQCPDEMVEKLTGEVSTAIKTLESLEPAVTFIGGSRLSDDDWTCQAAHRMSCELAREGIPVRVGGTQALARAVASGVAGGDPNGEAQGFLRHANAEPMEGLNILQRFDHSSTTNQLIGLRSKAVVALPGGLGTLDELFGVLTQIQTGNLPDIPVVLVGKEYWEPIFAAMKKNMLSEVRQTISPEDLDRVLITDSPKEALRELGV